MKNIPGWRKWRAESPSVRQPDGLGAPFEVERLVPNALAYGGLRACRATLRPVSAPPGRFGPIPQPINPVSNTLCYKRNFASARRMKSLCNIMYYYDGLG